MRKAQCYTGILTTQCSGPPANKDFLLTYTHVWMVFSGEEPTTIVVFGFTSAWRTPGYCFPLPLLWLRHLNHKREHKPVLWFKVAGSVFNDVSGKGRQGYFNTVLSSSALWTYFFVSCTVKHCGQLSCEAMGKQVKENRTGLQSLDLRTSTWEVPNFRLEPLLY